MRVGDRVTFVTASGIWSEAKVTGVEGAGSQGFKFLDLVVGGKAENHVPHETDARGKGYWTLSDRPPKKGGKK